MASMVSSFFLVLLFVTIISLEAKELPVGGSTTAWKVPDSTSETLNKWAESQRFQVGDTLVWKFDSAKDSVLQVTKEAYMNCNTTSPIKEHKNGSTKVVLRRAGAFYFISGAKGACEKGEKLVLVVMSQNVHHILTPAPAPADDGQSSGASVVAGGGLVAALAVLGVVLGFII